MFWRNFLSKFIIYIIITAGCFCTSEIKAVYKPSNVIHGILSYKNSGPVTFPFESKEIDNLNQSLRRSLTSGDFSASKTTIERIIQKISYIQVDEKTLSESYYFIGVYHSLLKNDNDAVHYLTLCISLKEKNRETDDLYARALYNLGVIYKRSGDFKKLEDYSFRSLEVEKTLFGDGSPTLITTYSNLIMAFIELQEYESAINYSNIALKIGTNYPDSVSPLIMANLYNNLGVCFNRLADFSKAKIFFDKCESIYLASHLEKNDNYLNLLNSLADTYRALGLAEESAEYFEKGINLAVSTNSSLAYNLINSYAIILGNNGKEKKGEVLLAGALNRAKSQFGETSHYYFEVLSNYAFYLKEFKIDINKSLNYYRICMDYLSRNQQDLLLNIPITIGYSQLLTESGEPWKALESLQSLLISQNKQNKIYGSLDNPGIEDIKIDENSLWILRTKYNILCDLFKKSSDQKILEAASNTSELIVELLEKVRINISEEKSRLVLGDQYRDAYLNSIHDFNLLYSKTNNPQYLNKAFEYSEKSKVAGLLASSRELKATQFHVPPDVADLEKKLLRDITLFNARIEVESVREKPDTLLINKLKDNLLFSTRMRDSLILVFEKHYPDYFAIKYNTKVADMNDIPQILGRNVNYINYIISRDILYIFLVNRKHQRLLALPIDSAFFGKVRQFRNLLSMPSSSADAKSAFEKYQTIGLQLNKTLVDPVRKYLISDKLLISPDNILSYLPFETIPSGSERQRRILYNNLNYLMDDFDISYTYSATFMAESLKVEYGSDNKLIAFAPDYSEPINIQSILMNRQASTGVLPDLPYARQEAEYVADITDGKLYMNEDATESVYKTEAGKYDIIHLAMHTILNDKDPMHSTLIFSQNSDSIEDGYLRTYEIYGIPLKARMVVLSSCNTGTGYLSSGEGILSLARGFIYSGCQSVIMSMWEVEDKSGTEIIKMFYKNLKNGYSKSGALRKARITYLKNADQLHSHPYFWSTLVVYGNNDPLYHSKYLIIIAVSAIIIIIASAVLYYRKRKYS
jgi:CHAT domain-containing protein